MHPEVTRRIRSLVTRMMADTGLHALTEREYGVRSVRELDLTPDAFLVERFLEPFVAERPQHPDPRRRTEVSVLGHVQGVADTVFVVSRISHHRTGPTRIRMDVLPLVQHDGQWRVLLGADALFGLQLMEAEIDRRALQAGRHPVTRPVGACCSRRVWTREHGHHRVDGLVSGGPAPAVYWKSRSTD